MPNHGNAASVAFRRLKPNELSFEPAAFLAQSVVNWVSAFHNSPHNQLDVATSESPNELILCFHLWRRVVDNRGYFATAQSL